MPHRDEAVNAELTRRVFDYAETLVPSEPFCEKESKEHSQLGLPQIKHPFYVNSGEGSVGPRFSALLSYHVLKGGLSAWPGIGDPLIPVKLAVTQGKCAWNRIAIPTTYIELVEYANGEGVLCYFEHIGPIGHGFVFSSDPMHVPGRFDIWLTLEEDDPAPDLWKPLLLRVIRGTRMLDGVKQPSRKERPLNRWIRRKSR